MFYGCSVATCSMMLLSSSGLHSYVLKINQYICFQTFWKDESIESVRLFIEKKNAKTDRHTNNNQFVVIIDNSLMEILQSLT